MTPIGKVTEIKQRLAMANTREYHDDSVVDVKMELAYSHSDISETIPAYY